MGGPLPKKNVSLSGAGVPSAGDAFTKKKKQKNTDYIVLALASFLIFGKVNPGPPSD